jgi:SNF2 family DNA or RNA helicase
MTSIAEVVKWGETFKQDVPDDVRQMLAEVNTSLSELKDASRMTDAELEVAGLPLLPYQRAGVSYASNARRTFIADEMGLGKTLQAIATLEYVYDSYPAVVVCPATLVLNWKAEYNRFLPDVRVAVVKDRKTFPDEGTYDVVVVGYSNITSWEKRLSNHNAYVFDESHYCKTPTAQRTKSAKKIAGSAPKGAMILCLTGTPVTNRPAEYASQLDILGQLNKFGGLWGFYRRYCDAFKDKWGQWHLEGHSHLDELNDKLRSVCYIRRTKDQVLTDLPPVIHNPYVVDGTPELAAEYKKAEDDIIAYLVNRAKEIAMEMGKSPYSAGVVAKIRAESNEHLVKLSVLRRIAAKGKMQEAQDWVQSRLDAGKKVVIAAHHRDIVDELTKRFNACKIQGGMKIEDVEEAKRKFQNDPSANVMVLSIQAAKTGHTLTAAQDILFVELPWSPADIDQTYSRLHRHGQKGSVTATYMLMSGTIDEAIYKLTEKKRKVMNSAVDGDVFDDDDASTAQLVLSFLPQ